MRYKLSGESEAQNVQHVEQQIIMASASSCLQEQKCERVQSAGAHQAARLNAGRI